jgi:hypothetical protein
MTSSSTSSEDVGDRANALGSAVSSHTPGPWAYRQSHSDTCDLEVLDSDGNVVAGEYGVREQANARLIAAAPELYEALSKIEKRLFAFGHVQTNLDRHDVASMLDVARGALAKARGEQVSA